MQKMSITIIVSFNVEDFDKWNSEFDQGENSRTEPGITVTAYRNMDAPNNVWAIGTATSKEAFDAYFSAPAQQERMKNGGVMSLPTITFLESG